MTLPICKRLVLVEDSATTRLENANVHQVMLALPVKEQNVKMIAADEGHVFL